MSESAVRDACGARAAEYIDLLGSVEQMSEADRVRIAEWAGTLGGGRVIDAGCGPGHWTDLLRRVGCDAVGVDMVPQFVAHARAAFPQTPFHEGSLRALAAPDASVRGILAWYSLVHADDAALLAALDEFARVIQPGGSLLVGFFAGEPGEEFAHAVAPARWRSIAEISALLDERGFRVVAPEARTDPGFRPHAAVEAVRVR